MAIEAPAGPVMVTEYMESHVNCRCTLIPRPKSYADVLGDPSLPDNRPPIIPGPAAFRSLPPATQLAILGPGKFELYKQGVPLEAFVDRHVSSDWGASRVEKPLRQVMQELQAGGWSPGGMEMPPIVVAGRDAVRAPVFGPGQFTTLDEAKAWAKANWPTTDVEFSEAGHGPANIHAVNSTMKALENMRRLQPMAFERLAVVRYRDFTLHEWSAVSGPGGGNAYAHVYQGASDSRYAAWRKKRPTEKPTALSVLEFNTVHLNKPNPNDSPAWVEAKIAYLQKERDFFSKLGTADITAKVDNKWMLAKLAEYDAEIAQLVASKEQMLRGEVIPGFAQMLHSDLKSGWHPDVLTGVPGMVNPDGTLTMAGADRLMQSVAVHEYGHVLDAWAQREVSIGIQSVTPAWGDLQDIWSRFRIVEQTGGAVSNYSKTDAHERIAEGFMALVLQPEASHKAYTRKLGNLLSMMSDFVKIETKLGYMDGGTPEWKTAMAALKEKLVVLERETDIKNPF